MSNYKRISISLFLLLCSISLLSCLKAQEKPQGNHDLQSWTKDINYLRTELPNRHTDLYHHTPKAVFDSAYTSLLNKLPDLNNYERLIEVSKIMHLMGPGNGHSRVRYSGGILKKQLPFRGYKFRDGFYVVSTSPENEHLLGSKIREIDGMPIDSILQELGTFIPADNDWNRLLRASLFISLPEILYGAGITGNPESVKLGITKSGSDSEIVVEATPVDDDFEWIDSWEDYHFKYTANGDWKFVFPEEQNAPLHLQEHDDWFRTILMEDEEILYARMNRTRDYEGGKISDFFDDVFEYLDEGKAEKLILDLRYNVGGNLMTTPPFINGIICRDEINQPDKFIVLTGRATYSAAQYLATRLDHETNATFIGEPTGGKPNLFGDAPRFELPNTKIRLSASVLYFQVTWPWDNSMSILPDHYVPLTYDQFIKGEDLVLEKALNYDLPILSEQIQNRYNDNGIEGLLSLAREYDTLEEYRFRDEDITFYNFGVSLQDQYKYSDATKVFEYYRSDYPSFMPLLERLAYSYEKLGNSKKSKEVYRTILKLNPDHEKANQALNK